MSQAPSARTFEVRHVQLVRAVIAGVAAVMITFSPDHSAQVGFTVFSGFAIVTSVVVLLSAWSVYSTGARWPAMTVGAVSMIAGLVASVSGFRTSAGFFVIVIAWAALTGIVEVVAGARALRRADRSRPQRGEARDTLTVGILSLALAVALALVPSGFALQYYIEDAGRSFTLTGITIGVGIFGGYAAIVAVYLAIAAFSPRTTPDVEPAPAADERSAA